MQIHRVIDCDYKWKSVPSGTLKLFQTRPTFMSIDPSFSTMQTGCGRSWVGFWNLTLSVCCLFQLLVSHLPVIRTRVGTSTYETESEMDTGGTRCKRAQLVLAFALDEGENVVLHGVHLAQGGTHCLGRTRIGGVANCKNVGEARDLHRGLDTDEPVGSAQRRREILGARCLACAQELFVARFQL